DPDAGQALTYAITAGNTDNTFQIDSATGKLSIADNTKLTVADNPTFNLTVKVTDNATTPASATATVTVKVTANSAPAIAAQSFNAPQASANGTLVGALAASDPDAGQSLTYAITAGNTDNTFSINATTGALTVADSTKLTADSPFALTVQVTDNA